MASRAGTHRREDEDDHGEDCKEAEEVVEGAEGVALGLRASLSLMLHGLPPGVDRYGVEMACRNTHSGQGASKAQEQVPRHQYPTLSGGACTAQLARRGMRNWGNAHED